MTGSSRASDRPWTRCRWINRAGVLALGSALVLGGMAPAGADPSAPPSPSPEPSPSSSASTAPASPSAAETTSAAEPSPSAAATTPAPSEPVATSLAVGIAESGYIGTGKVLTATLTEEASGAPVVGAQVLVQRYRPAVGEWASWSYTTDGAGRVSHPYTVTAGLNRFRVSYTGDPASGTDDATAGPFDVRPLKIATRLIVGGADKVVDERRVAVTIRWKAADGRRVTGRVELYRKPAGTTAWSRVARPTVRDGFVSVLVRPRSDTVWRAVGPAGSWHKADRSNWHWIDNVPPISPVVLPAGAPKPDITLRPQRRGFGNGLNAQVTRIPDGVWRSMVGRSWHAGCPVGRSQLRLIRLNYWGFDGYRHRGELVVNAGVAADAVGTFRALYKGRYPVRTMYRVDRFGWSRKLRGANDYKSMAADNTSAFNCRQVVGRPGVMSPHSYGDSIDINPWENPYVSAQGTYPNSWWLSRSHDRVAWRSWSHPVVQAFSRHGFVWGGGYRDFHHFQS